MAKEKITGIYKITSPSGKIYIGQSLDIEKRWKYYRSLCCKSQSRLYNSLLKNGVENHLFEIIHIIKTSNLTEDDIIFELNKLEAYYILEYNTFSDYNKENGLNLTKGGDSKITSIETKEKLKSYWTEDRRKKASESYTGSNNPNYGVEVKKETKDKISVSLKGRKKILSDEHILNKSISMSGEKNPMYGKQHSIETKNKMSSSLKGNGLGKKRSPDLIKKAIDARMKKKKERIEDGTYVKRKRSKESIFKDKETKRKNIENKIADGTYIKYTHSEETRKKQSEAKKGKKWSPEVRLKISETKKMIRQERLSMIF